MKTLNYYSDFTMYDYLSKDGNKNVKNIGYDLQLVNNEKVLKVFELKPTTQKSFYGKAKIIETQKGKYLLSYDTIVCGIDSKNQFNRYWNDYSVTTKNHINSFLQYYEFSTINKKQWLDMEYKNIKKIL